MTDPASTPAPKTYKVLCNAPPLQGTPGNFCITPMQIMDQMARNRRNALKAINDGMKAAGLEREVEAVTPLNDDFGFAVRCTPAAAAKIGELQSVREVSEMTIPPRKPPFEPFFRR